MSDHSELARFLDSPELLCQLCKDVITRLDKRRQGAGLDEREKQLNEIAQTINKLEKAKVSVPDELRRLKTGLVAKLAIRDEINNKLKKLADGFEEVLCDLHSRIGKANKTCSQKIPVKKRSKKLKTTKEVLRKEIIKALNTLGGSGGVQQILVEMEKQLNGKLLPRDMETVSIDLVWKNNACWERNRMVNEGILKNDSPRGIWELSRR